MGLRRDGGLAEYNRALGLKLPEGARWRFGIAVSGDRFYELHVRSGGEYFIERGEFGKPTVIRGGGVTFDKRSPQHQVRRWPGTRRAGRSIRPAADGLRSLRLLRTRLTDAPPAVTLKRMVGEERRRRGPRERRDGLGYRQTDGPRPQTGDYDFGLTAIGGALASARVARGVRRLVGPDAHTRHHAVQQQAGVRKAPRPSAPR